MKYLVIADQDTVLGFRCAGVPGAFVSDHDEALEALRTARDRGVGVVILTEEIAHMIQEDVDEIRFSEALPLVVEVSGPKGPWPDRRSLADIIREAVGVKV